ncbi:hypothetical protein [Caballeronia sp. AZ7_KS35]|uniref:hypothetical protein n=1 Tax=Caballeronia sp. AZ7_KS35 TaxID=2921762 RepID=UPI002028DA9C|nr:hypothetical protein [Caballeronia sp. AZ7_KS35]
MRDGSYQAAGVYIKVQALLEEARAEGFNAPSIAYALLTGARDVMQDNTAFLRELERFKAHWNMP